MSCITFAKHVDDLVIGFPAIIPAVLTIGFGIMSKSKGKIASSLGHIGARTFGLITMVAGLPLIIWNIAKIIFANLLNMVTFGRCPPCVKLADWINHRSGLMIVGVAKLLGQEEIITHLNESNAKEKTG